MDSLQPFVTEHFIVFPYKSKWERVSHLKFKHGESILTPYPFVFTLYIEMKWFAEDLPSGKPADDIPLELVLAETEAEEATMRKWKRKLMEEPSSPSRQGPHRAKMETSSEASSNKKPLKESKRSTDEEAQQEYQDTPASNAIAVKEQGRSHHVQPPPASDIELSSPEIPKHFLIKWKVSKESWKGYGPFCAAEELSLGSTFSLPVPGASALRSKGQRLELELS